MQDATQHWILASNVAVAQRNLGGFRDIFAGEIKLTVGGGLYVVASCTGVDDHVTNLISTGGTGRLEVSDPSSGPSACGNPRYQVLLSGTNPMTVTFRVFGLTHPVEIINLTLDLEKALTENFGFLHAGQSVEEGCANDWVPMSPEKSLVAAIRAPCIIPHDVGAVGVARQHPPLFRGINAFLSGDDFRVEALVESAKVKNRLGAPINLGTASVGSDFGIYNHPGTHAFGVAFYKVPKGHSIEVRQRLTIHKRQSP